MTIVILVEVAVTAPAGAGSTLRFSDRAIRPFPPGDADRPNGIFDNRIVEAPSLRRALFEDLASLTPAVGFGAMTLSNADHGLDAYQGYAWGEIVVLQWTEGTAFSAATMIYKGLCAQPAFPLSASRADRVTVGLYDYRAELSKPLQTTFYAGTNGSGGVLYEGAADGLKGRPKPLAYGNLVAAHVVAPQVNAGVMAYQLHEAAIQGTESLFDRGDAAGYTDDGDFSGAAFDAHAPAAAHYCTDIGRGLVKLTGAPVGQLTFGFKGDAAGGYVETAGPILGRVLAKAGVPGGRIGASVGLLASTSVVGLFAGEPIDAEDLIAFVAASAPAAVITDRLGTWQAVPFGPPGVSPDVSIGEHQVIDLTSDDTAPQPVGEVRVGWGRIWQTFSGSELAAALKGTTSEERLKDEFRWAIAADATTKARLPRTWRTLELKTALRVEADALALAGALKDLFALKPDGTPRRFWRLTVELAQAAPQGLGDTVALDYPPKGLSGNFLLVGEELLRPRRDQAIWTLWG